MVNKKGFFDKTEVRRDSLIALYVAVITIGLDMFRFYTQTFLETYQINELVSYTIAGGIVIILLTIIILGHSDVK